METFSKNFHSMFSQFFSKLTLGSAREFGQYFRNNWPPKKVNTFVVTRISNLLPEITILTKWDKCKVTIEKSKSSHWVENLLKLFSHFQSPVVSENIIYTKNFFESFFFLLFSLSKQLINGKSRNLGFLYLLKNECFFKNDANQIEV